MNKDVSEWVDWNNPDDECLPITECICGAKFEAWKFIISIYDDSPNACPECGAKLFFRMALRIYQVIEDE